jgi:DNA-binding transcriptional LysR family regulator
MHCMHVSQTSLAELDLNLLRVLDAVLTTRHVTQAARRLGLSQSATSHALARLREALGDELLVRGPDGLVPTARGAALQGPLREIMERLTQALAPPTPFDPATARRTFRLGAADYAQFVLLPPVLTHLAAHAPGVDLWVLPAPPAEAVPAALADGELDLMVGATTAPLAGAGLFERALFEEQFVCVVREGHPIVRAAEDLDLETFCTLPHAFIAPRGRSGGAVDSALERIGRARRIALAVPHFLVIPHVIAGSDLIVTLAARVAWHFAHTLPLRVLPPPLPLPAFGIGLAWHERQHRDPGHVWLRDLLARVGAGV